MDIFFTFEKGNNAFQQQNVTPILLTEAPEMRINLRSVKDSMAVLDVMFNSHPDINNLKCNSVWVQTTSVDNEDGTSDVLGVLTLLK